MTSQERIEHQAHLGQLHPVGDDLKPPPLTGSATLSSPFCTSCGGPVLHSWRVERMHENPITIRFKGMPMAELYSRPLVTIGGDDKLEVAIERMTENFVHSLPVWSSERNACIGTIDLQDVVSFIVKNLQGEKSSGENIPSPAELLGKERVINARNQSGCNPYVLLDINNSPVTVFDYLSRGLHRLFIQNRSGDVIGTISQFDLVMNIYQARHEKNVAKVLGSIKARDVLEQQKSQHQQGLIYFNRDPQTITQGGQVLPLVWIKSTTPVLEVLKLLSSHGLSAVPMVNSQDGKLEGNFSVTDIRGLFKEKTWSKPVTRYLFKHSRPSLTPYVLDSFDIPLGKIIEIFVNEGFHHIWIVEHSKPVGCISLTDILWSIRNFQVNEEQIQRR